MEALTALVNERLKLVFEWCSFNKLSLNASKCKYMLFTNKKIDSDPIILLDSLPIERVNEFKYLGVHLDDKLKFNKHVDHLCGILSRYCGMTFKLRGHLDLKSAKNTYYSCIYSAIKYCICTYGGLLQSTQRGNRLKSQQNRIVKNLFGNFVPQNTDIYKRLRILKIEDVHKLYIGIYMYKIMRLGECPTLRSNLDLRYPEHTYDTRSRNNLVLPFPRVDSLRISYKYQCNQIWNQIPDHIKGKNSLASFKRALTNKFLDMY